MPDARSPARPRPGRRRLPVADYARGVLAGDRVALAQAITLIESDLPSDAALAASLLDALLPHTGQARRVGITGVPGAGKSTFIDALGLHLIRDRGEQVAVLTIDPSSPVSKGSILGDKTRMERLSVEPRAYIRPSPSQGHLGGVARRTRETMLLCEAAGFETVIVETVGVGQSEVAVRSMVDFFLLLMIPGAGDELQGIKRGIVEMVDAIAINKADGENRRRAERARADYASALHLFPAAPDGWVPRVLACSALTGEGIPEVWERVVEHRQVQTANGHLEARRRGQALDWLHELLSDGLRRMLRADPRFAARLPALEAAVAAAKMTPFAAARELLGIVAGQSA